MPTMAKKKPDDEPGAEAKKPKYPSRAKVKYLLVPVDIFEEIKRIAEEEERQISTVARRALRYYLESIGRWPIKKKPPTDKS